MLFLLLIIAFVVLIFFVRVRTVVTHPISCIINGLKDFYLYFKERRWNIAPRGEVLAFTGLFGKGKTLSMVAYASKIYHKYNGKFTWNKFQHKLLPNKFIVLSNFELKYIPYIPFKDMEQFVNLCNDLTSGEYSDSDKYNYCVLALVDEASSVLNSRSFAKNFNPTTINAFMQVRKFNCNFYMTSQRFAMIDLLARSVCSYEVRCDKIWRLQKLTYIDAWDAENCSNPEMLKADKVRCLYISDYNYNSYDTSKVATDIAKDVKNNNIRSVSETVTNLGDIKTETTNYKKSWLKKKIK